MFDIQQECINYIKTKIEKYITDYKLYVIKSDNQNNTDEKFPDINIVIEAEIFNEEMKAIIDFELVHSSLPCKVNIIDLEDALKSSVKMIKV